MPQPLRRVLTLLLLLGAWGLIGQYRAPLPVMMSQALAGPGGQAGDSRTAGVERPSHDLSNPRIFTKVVLYVKDNYVDPKRIKPREMLVNALEYVEKAVPDVMVEANADQTKVKVTVGSKVQTFDTVQVDSLWKLSFTLKDVLRFINENMKPMEDTRDAEYAAVNGMLSKLDPHSGLLRPDLYREMKLTTKGEFGGLGFVIQMKEGNLTVVKVLPKTPAYRAGIKKEDVIQKIGEESTVNMDLNEAVSKLRGPVDSKITITLNRRGWEHPQAETLTRAMISIESVQSKLLNGGVGYVRLKNFQGNTTRELQGTLLAMQREAEAKGGGLKGLVLDLRGNPGGLLEQAIQVSDLFVSQGVLVATVGHSEQLREEKRAHPDEGDLAYPVVVLVNAGSASASEIVAGALKNLNRAVIVGRQTFGKGSVQVLYDFPDDSALKLTIAKYLTPGDLSIQEVGIVPDIQLTPTRVTRDRVDVFAPRRSIGEADLDSHFGNPGSERLATKRDEVLSRQKPTSELKYLKEDSKGKDASAKAHLPEEGKPPRAARNDKAPEKRPSREKDPLLDTMDRGVDEDLDDQMDAELQDEVKEDFEVQFARDYVLQAPFVDREKMLAAGRAFVEQKQREEEERIDAAIGALGVDWSRGESPHSPLLAAVLRPGSEKKIQAGDLLELELQVENRGAEPVKRLRAWTDSDNPFLDRREFIFGALRPGEKRSWKVPVKLPRDLTSRRDGVTVRFFDDGGPLGVPLVSELSSTELPRPAFSFNWQLQDACEGCNGDGIAQLGEDLDLVVDVTNTGVGKALDAFATIKNVGDPAVFIEKGRFKLGELLPGETRTARFKVDLKHGYHGSSFPLRLAIVDEPLEEVAIEKIHLPVEEGPPRPLGGSRAVVRLPERTELRAAAAADAPLVGRIPKAALFARTARSGDFIRVEVDKDRFAFARAQDAREVRGKTPPAAHELQYVPRRVPPTIALNVDPAQGGTVADGERFSLTGNVSASGGDVDLWVLVNDQKVYFKTVSGTKKEPVKFKFASDFPLKEGNNHVLVVARESPDFAARKALVIRRRPAALAQKQDVGGEPGVAP